MLIGKCTSSVIRIYIRKVLSNFFSELSSYLFFKKKHELFWTSFGFSSLESDLTPEQSLSRDECYI